VQPLPDISTARWHTAICDVYPERRTLGSALHFIIENLPQYIYQRGSQMFSDLMWEIAGKKPRIRQFVLTSADYCKLYLTVLSFHIRRPSSSIPIDCGEDFVYAPLSVGLISRTPYLTFPRVFLSHMYHTLRTSMDESIQSDLIVRTLGQMIHGVPVPLGSSSLSLWNLPRLTESAKNQLQLYMADCGLEGAPLEEARPVPSAFNRGFAEVDLIAIFDLLSLDTILFTLNTLLLEQKVLIVSSRYSSSFIAHLCESLRVLMNPFDWQHVFIPLIPAVTKESFFDPVTKTPRIPLWIDSALTSDHIHPLRFLEAPAPLFGGLRIRGTTTVSVQPALRQLFPDLNIIDIDNDAVFSAVQRVDRISTPLPGFPRKLSQGIADRLSPLADMLCISGRLPQSSPAAAKERLDRYAKWDDVFPIELFTGENKQEQISASQSQSAIETPSVVDSFRRRSLVRTSGIINWQGDMERSRQRTWLGRSFFGRASTNQFSRTSLSGASTPPSEDPAMNSDPVERIAPQLIQAAMIEAWSKLFFAYREFLAIDSTVKRSTSLNSQASLFIGSDRQFSSEQFVKTLERSSPLGVDILAFVRGFLDTQCWDLFLRTTALHPVCHVFDTACAFFAITNKAEYLRYKQAGMAEVPVPQAVLEEVEMRFKPCPLNKKPKQHFFDELLSLIARRHHIEVCMFSQPDDSLVNWAIDQASPRISSATTVNESKDVLAMLSHVLTGVLPRKFADGNTESAKLISVSRQSRFGLQDIVNVRDGLPLVAEGKMASHIVHAVLLTLRQAVGFAAPSKSSPKSAMSLKKQPSVTDHNWDESVSLWSGRSRTMMKNQVSTDESKLLGGIPKSTLGARAPQPAPVLLRKWGDQQLRSLRLIFRVTDATRVDYHCTSCGSSKSLLDVLREGRYADFVTSTDIDFITSLCGNCEALVCPEIVPCEPLMTASGGSHVKILRLPVLLSKLRGSIFPLTVDLYLNLSFLLGTHAEMYTGFIFEKSEKNQLRGVVGMSEAIADFLSCGAGEASDDGGGLSPSAMAVVPSPLRSGADSEVVSPRSEAESSPTEKLELSGSASENSSGEDEMPESPKERALWRVRQYRKILREKERRKQVETQSAATNLLNANLSSNAPIVVRVHVDEPRRVFSPTTRSARKQPMTEKRSPSPPAPPSERRPADSAPRRTRKSGGNDSSATSPFPAPAFSR